MLEFNLEDIAGTSEVESEWDVAIVGGGPAGLTAALYSGRSMRKTIIFEKLAVGGQISVTDEVDNYPGIERIKGPELARLMEKHAKRFGAKIVFAEVLKIRKEEGGKFTLETTEGAFKAKAVIWATGAEPRKLGVPGEKEFTGRGVSYCAVCDGPFFKGKPVAVIGGGDSAFTEALYLAGIAGKVYLIHRREQFRAQRIYVEQLKSKPNVEFLLNKVVVEFVGDKMLKGLRLVDTKTGEESFLEVSAAFVYIGLRPVNEVIQDLVDLDERGFALVGEDTKTKTPGLFVAGDGRVKFLRQVVTAVADGAVAAMMADEYIREVESEGQP
ncbi:MAG: thioredoxin-disulfide reductase [Thermotogae bacterium]|nr:thioredoxin-disulfide reductase [Thermotogota bacterium]